MGDLVAAIGPQVPAAIAARAWYQHRGKQFSTENQRIFYAIKLELPRYGVEIPRNRWNDDVAFTVNARACAICGQPFISDAKTATCSRPCSRRLRVNINGEKSPPMTHHEPVFRDEDEHPELVALRLIVRALNMLADREARQRVLDYVQHLVPIDPSPPRTKPNGADEIISTAREQSA